MGMKTEVMGFRDSEVHGCPHIVIVSHKGQCQICGNKIDKISEYGVTDKNIERRRKAVIGFCLNDGDDCDFSWTNIIEIKIMSESEDPESKVGKIKWMMSM